MVITHFSVIFRSYYDHRNNTKVITEFSVIFRSYYDVVITTDKLFIKFFRNFFYKKKLRKK